MPPPLSYDLQLSVGRVRELKESLVKQGARLGQIKQANNEQMNNLEHLRQQEQLLAEDLRQLKILESTVEGSIPYDQLKNMDVVLEYEAESEETLRQNLATLRLISYELLLRTVHNERSIHREISDEEACFRLKCAQMIAARNELAEKVDRISRLCEVDLCRKRELYNKIAELVSDTEVTEAEVGLFTNMQMRMEQEMLSMGLSISPVKSCTAVPQRDKERNNRCGSNKQQKSRKCQSGSVAGSHLYEFLATAKTIGKPCNAISKANQTRTSMSEHSVIGCYRPERGSQQPGGAPGKPSNVRGATAQGTCTQEGASLLANLFTDAMAEETPIFHSSMTELGGNDNQRTTIQDKRVLNNLPLTSSYGVIPSPSQDITQVYEAYLYAVTKNHPRPFTRTSCSEPEGSRTLLKDTNDIQQCLTSPGGDEYYDAKPKMQQDADAEQAVRKVDARSKDYGILDGVQNGGEKVTSVAQSSTAVLSSNNTTSCCRRSTMTSTSSSMSEARKQLLAALKSSLPNVITKVLHNEINKSSD